MAVVIVVAEAVASNAETVTNMKGTVKWYDRVKGYGFIQGEDNADYFVHRTGVKDQIFSLEEGQSVEFNVKDGPKGPMAVDVETK